MDQAEPSEFDLGPDLLLEAINSKYGYDFRHYSPASIKRRVKQAMASLNCKSLQTLQEKVLQESESFYDLLQFLTVPVTEMFRDPRYFKALREKVIPHLKTYPSLKIWVAGCSTGEEAYSLAILLQEEGLLDHTILYATDINPISLEKAERGVFDIAEIPKFTQNYQKSGGANSFSSYYSAAFSSAKFNASLRKSISFSNHSLVTDAAFAEVQLISCRNVLIYFDRGLQNRAFGLFNESLCRKGFLGLGTKETIALSHYVKDFSHVSQEDRIFQKK